MSSFLGSLSSFQKLLAGTLAMGALLLGIQALPVSSVANRLFCNSPEGVLDCVVNSINDRKLENLIHYVHGTVVTVNIDELEKQFPGMKKVFTGVSFTITNKEYKKIDDDGNNARVHVRADIIFQAKGGVAKQVIDFTAILLKDRGKWLLHKDSLQELLKSLTTFQ